MAEKNNKQELIKLIQENPSLPVVFFVNNDMVAYDYGSTFMEDFRADKEVIYKYERFGDLGYSDDKEEVIEYYCDYFADEEKYRDLSQEEYEKVMENWVNQNIEHYEAIVIYVS